MELISISNGNMKIGKIASFSLPPIESCNFHKYCADKCYAKKAYKAYPNTRRAYDRNFRIAKENLENLKTQIIEFLRSYKHSYFRMHVSGDFFSQDYLNMWKEICKQFPKINFMAYTKCYSFDYEGMPENMEVIFSTFENMPAGTSKRLREKHNRPVALAGTKNPDEEYYSKCIDDCSKCKLCWKLSETKKGVFFHYH
jgi:hypothetical protein